MAEAVNADVVSPLHQRSTRQVVRQACDPCRLRKVKCNTNDHADSNRPGHSSSNATQNPICRRCANLGLQCTYLLPSRVRGPQRKDKSKTRSATSLSTGASPTQGSVAVAECSPNPDASSITSPGLNGSVSNIDQQLFLSRGNEVGSTISPQPWSTSPQSFLIYPASGISLGPPYHTDSLCSRKLLKRILDDYLDHLYPLIPVVHRPSFRQDLMRDRDLHDKDFLGLVICLCAATVGTMPKRFKEYRSFDPPIRFQSRTEMINHCYDLSMALRGPDYFDKINLQKWAASYLMGISSFQIGQQNQSRMSEVEAMQLARLLDLHEISRYDGLNCIEIQLRKKAFWLMFYGLVHSQLQHLRKERLVYLESTILSTINLEELMPLEVDDEVIFANEVISQPTATLSLTSGFNVHSRVFAAAFLPPPSRSSGTEKRVPCACVRSTEPLLQLTYLKDRLRDVKYMVDGIPAQLRQWAAGDEDDSLNGSTPEQSWPTIKAQFASMRANIHVTHLWLQSILLDQMDSIQQSLSTAETLFPPPPDPKLMWSEREDICRQLLHVLHGIPHGSLEPNGLHLTYKVRDVAVALLACPFEPHEEAARRASEYLRDFTERLSRLDASERMSTLSLQSWIDTDRW